MDKIDKRILDRLIKLYGREKLLAMLEELDDSINREQSLTADELLEKS